MPCCSASCFTSWENIESACSLISPRCSFSLSVASSSVYSVLRHFRRYCSRNRSHFRSACSLVMCFSIASAPLLFSCDRLPRLLYCGSFSGKHRNKTLTDCSQANRGYRISRKCAGGNNAARARFRVRLASDSAVLGSSSPLNKRFGDCWLV